MELNVDKVLTSINRLTAASKVLTEMLAAHGVEVVQENGHCVARVTPKPPAPVAVTEPSRRTLSPAARARISAAQKKRWKEWRKAK